jgi:hypothetical protein
VRSGSREVARLRRDNFLTANIPTSMHLGFATVKLRKNLPKWGFLEIPILFDVVVRDAVTVLTNTQLQAHDMRCEDCLAGIPHFIGADLLIDVTN